MGWGAEQIALAVVLSLIHISEPTRLRRISYAVFEGALVQVDARVGGAAGLGVLAPDPAHVVGDSFARQSRALRHRDGGLAGRVEAQHFLFTIGELRILKTVSYTHLTLPTNREV